MNELTKVSNLKPILYEILRAATCNNQPDCKDVNISQNMGVNLSHAVKKDGVNIIQLQNIKFDSIIPKLIEALQLVDQLELEYTSLLSIEHKPKEVIQIEQYKDPVKEFIKFVDQRDLDMKSIIDIIRSEFYDHLLENRSFVKNQALERMDLSISAIYQSKKRLREIGYANAKTE